MLYAWRVRVLVWCRLCHCYVQSGYQRIFQDRVMMDLGKNDEAMTGIPKPVTCFLEEP
jgi:hypothetical protein